MKTCTKCLQRKEIAAFYKDAQKSDGLTTQCRDCINARQRAAKDADPVTVRAAQRLRAYAYTLRVKFGVTVAEYNALLAAQDGRCAICRKPETARSRHGNLKHLAFDHCHRTGHLRALLCDACNNGLGRFCDDPALLRAAADYLESHAVGVAS